MKKKISLFFIFILLFIQVACSYKIQTREDLLNLIEIKGKENIKWSDFEHLERLEEEEYEGKGVFANIYKLKDNVIIRVQADENYKPESILIYYLDDLENIANAKNVELIELVNK